MINGVHHICISTIDIDRAIDFYLEAIPGSEVAYREDLSGSETLDRVLGLDHVTTRWALLRAHNVYIEFFQFQNPSPGSRAGQPQVNSLGYTHFCLDVDDIEVEVERLAKAGMTFHCPPQAFPEMGIRTVYGRDLDGNIVELQEVKGRPDIDLGHVRG